MDDTVAKVFSDLKKIEEIKRLRRYLLAYAMNHDMPAER